MRPLVLLAALLAVGLLTAAPAPPPDTEPSSTRPLPPHEAAAGWKLPAGFAMDVFAAEPDVLQPIGMAFDPRGRLWVAENFTYAEARVKFATNLDDRVTILEDTDGDGRMDRRKVFLDGLKILTSVETGLGGVWLMCPPRLLFLPDRDGDDVPDGPAETLLDGFETATGSHHTFANGLRWGPDGWLWGRVGISSPTRVGRPGAKDSERIVMGGGIWRYDPRTRVVESVAHGTTNPWGLDWNADGEPFFINTVIGHFWHAVPGARLRRMYGDDPEPRAYELIEQHADHFHFDTGAGWTRSRAGQADGSVAATSDALGGGHAHSGLMIYQGGNWPAEYEGEVFTLNFHGRRLNREHLARRGAGYVARHAPDFAASPDIWFRGLDILQGPDGAAYLSDWSDTGECHDHDGVHRSSGRIFRLAWKDGRPPGPRGIVPAASDADLVAMQFGDSEWHRRQARAVLRDRAVAGKLSSTTVPDLRGRLEAATDRAGRLHALWALRAMDAVDAATLTPLLADRDEHVRAWAVRLLSDLGEADRAGFDRLAAAESSALVRLYLASALGRMSLDARTALATALVRHGEDDADHDQGKMIWYGVIPLVAKSPPAAVELAMNSRLRIVRRNVARALAEDLAAAPDPLDALIARAAAGPADAQADVLGGILDALRGVRKIRGPAGWETAGRAFSTSADPRVKELCRELSVLFGDGRALDELRAILKDASAEPVARREALRSLVDARAEGVAALAKSLVDDASLRGPSIAALIGVGDADAPGLIGSKYPWMSTSDRRSVLGAAVTRVATASAVVAAVADGRIPKADLDPALARQIAGLGDDALRGRLAEAWGVVGGGTGDKRAAIAGFRAELVPALRGADLPAGRRHFQRLCAGCHVLYGEGGQVGPDLTGSGRANLDYLLENVVDPGAVVASDFRMTVAELADGRTLNGLLREANPRTLTLLTATGRVTVERSEVSRLETLPASMMPEGLLESLAHAERRDLVGYLMHDRQEPTDSKP